MERRRRRPDGMDPEKLMGTRYDTITVDDVLEPDQTTQLMSTAPGTGSTTPTPGSLADPTAEAQEATVYRQQMTEERLLEAIHTLQKYKNAKHNLEARVVADEEWWRMRNFEVRDRPEFGQQFPSAWLFNSIAGKHAAAMEAYPEANILPREQGDQEEARTLTEIIPVILDLCDFKETYSLNQWKKAKSGTGIYGIYWDATKNNGLGEINVRPVEILNFFAEPGVTDIQMSRNIFHVEAVDADLLRQQYPDKEINSGNTHLTLKEYVHDDYIENSDKKLVIDWYYKIVNNGVTELHYCKFVDLTVLYSTEDEGTPLYDDGEYPFVVDRLFPIEDSWAGFGYIDVGKYSQEQIDDLNQAMIVNALMNCRPRYFQAENSTINETEFADWKKQIVHVQGMLSDIDIKPIATEGLPAIYVNLLQNKIGELKETTSNQDVLTGSTQSGITAASAIQSLQETAGAPARDATRGTYRAFEQIVKKVIERIRQFYTTQRQFRITGSDGSMQFRSYDNTGIVPQPQTGIGGMDMGLRRPEFDVDVDAQKETPYTKLTNNTTVLDLYQRGIFNPQQVDVSLAVMDAMDMPRKDKIISKLQQNATMYDKMQQYAQLAYTLAQKFDPAIAAQLEGALMQDLGAMPQAGVGEIAGATPEAGEQPGLSGAAKAAQTRERDVRERAQQTTQI